MDGGRLHTVQLWIALPDAVRHGEAAFKHYPVLPRMERGGWRVTVLTGGLFEQTSPVSVFSPLLGIDLVADATARMTFPLDPTFEHGVLTLRGAARIAGEGATQDALLPGELLYLPSGLSELEIGCEQPTQLVVLGGEPFEEEVLLWWNFVARTQDELQEALDDWNGGEEGSARFGSVKPGSTASRLTAPPLKGLKLKI